VPNSAGTIAGPASYCERRSRPGGGGPIGPRTTYSFNISPRDEAGGQILDDLTSRGINLVANAAAQSADHIGSYFRMLQAEAGLLRWLPQPRGQACGQRRTGHGS
jgi:hypothetical protein